MRILLRLISLVVPRSERPRWREEWLAEVRHGGWRMLTGALPDAWAMRSVQALPPSRVWLPPLGGRTRRPFHGLNQDVRYALRSLSASPGFVLGVVLSLSVGMAAMTGAFSLVNSVALRPPAGIGQPDELLQLRFTQRTDGLPFEATTEDSYRAAVDRLTAFDGIAAFHQDEMVVAYPGEPANVPGMFVTGNYFGVLRVSPAAGRLIGPSDIVRSDAVDVVVLSHDAWLRHFAGNAGAIGSVVKVNGRARVVIGIAPPEFTGVRHEIDEDERPRVWLPMIRAESTQPRFVGVVARLRRTVSEQDARAEVSVLAASLPRGKQPGTPIDARVSRLGPKDATALELFGFLVSFLAVPAIVLALACVNAANLLASRASRRLRDAAIRLSIGATPWRVIRLLLVESLLLACGGCALGLAVTYWTTRLFGQYLAVVIHVDWRVALFAAALSAATAVAFGLAPAISAASRAGDLVRGAARRPATRSRAILIASQAALSLALMLTGWQFVNTVRLLAQHDGIRDADRLVIASMDVSKLNWPGSEVDGYYDRIIDRIGQLPGVTRASFSCACNPWGAWESRGGGAAYIWLSDHPPERPGSTLAMFAGGDLFGALELPVIAGRNFRSDEQRSPVRSVIVNQPFADKYLKSGAVGQPVRIGATKEFSASKAAVVVGVVQAPATRRTDSLPLVYYPAPLSDMPSRTLYVRFERPATETIGLLHAAIREVHPDAPRPDIATAEQRRWERHKSSQFLAASVSLLGLLALLLAAGGLYGVVAFVVTLRSQEIAVRMALGARPQEVVGMIVRQAMTPAAVGGALGVFGAVTTGLIVRARLYGASPLDPAAFAGATSLLFAVLFAATILPALRAARINPVDTLRTE